MDFNQPNEEMYIILDGCVDFTIDTIKNKFQDKFITEIAKDLYINEKLLKIDFEEFKSHKF